MLDEIDISKILFDLVTDSYEDSDCLFDGVAIICGKLYVTTLDGTEYRILIEKVTENQEEKN